MKIRLQENTACVREYDAQARREVVGFLNGGGGTLYIGAKEDGTAAGLEHPKKLLRAVAASLADAVAPDPARLLQCRVIRSEKKKLIAVSVQPGLHRPYYLRKKGMTPQGVYVRRNGAAQPVPREEIAGMLARTGAFEDRRSPLQELTFVSLKKELSARNLSFTEESMKEWYLRGEDGLYTNLALLLSDQCPAVTKAAAFQGGGELVFRDRQVFGGSLVRQMEEVYHYIDRSNRTKATFPGLDRVDTRDYPEQALREAWLNCIIHRDYQLPGANIVNVYEDRLELISLGGLMPGFALDSVLLGVSQSRNPHLAALFSRLGLIESYGTGIGKIRRGYQGMVRQPAFAAAAGVFRVTLPNCNEELPQRSPAARPAVRPEASPTKSVIDYLETHEAITRQEVETLLGVGSTKAFHILKELCANGLLRPEGNGKQSRYVRKTCPN